MSVAWFWTALGIEPTRERGEIRKAYAAKLKVTHPEDDPEGFQALRAAYERALSYAGPAARVVRITKPKEEAETDIVERRPRRRAPPKDDPVDQKTLEIVDPEPREPLEHTHDWRPADENDEEPTGPRRHDWRPPEPVVRLKTRRERTHIAREDIAPEIDAAEADYRAAAAALERLAADPETPGPALHAALDTVLAPRLMDSVDRFGRAETWLADLILRHRPRCDALIGPAIAFFHWDDNRVGPRSNAGARVLARRGDLQFLAGLRQLPSSQHAAFLALTHTPTRRRRLRSRLSIGLASQVQRLLATLRAERPGLLPSFNPAAIAWWEKALASPRLGPISIWTMAILPFIFALVLARGTDSASELEDAALIYPLALGAVAAVVLGRLYGIEWPRRLWRGQWREGAPAWLSFGWAPGLIVLVIVSALIPPSIVGGSILALAAALLAYWPTIVADPDRRPGARYTWQVRSLFSFTYLGVFWLFDVASLPSNVWLQMTAPVVAGAAGFVMGEGTLLAAWQQALSPAWRRRALLALGAVVLAAVAAIAAGWHNLILRALAAALIVAVVLAHKTPAAQLTPGRFRLRAYAMVYGWVAWFVLAAIAVSGPNRFTPLLVGGLWLLSGVAITVWGTFEWPAKVSTNPRHPRA